MVSFGCFLPLATVCSGFNWEGSCVEKSLKTIKILALGDVIGRAGRRVVREHALAVRDQIGADFFIVNGENLAGGFGVTEKIHTEARLDWRIDAMATGNHWHDKQEILNFGPNHDSLLLPANMYNVESLSRGWCVVSKPQRGQVAFVNLLGRVFMKGDNSCPFETFDKIYCELQAEGVRCIVVDFHAETSSEKQAFAHYVAGRASLVYGTHTHCPTADERIIQEFTGFQTDIGMTGGYESVIGMKVETSLPGFLGGKRKPFEPSLKQPWLCGLVATLDSQTGRCLSVERIQKRWDRLD